MNDARLTVRCVERHSEFAHRLASRFGGRVIEDGEYPGLGYLIDIQENKIGVKNLAKRNTNVLYLKSEPRQPVRGKNPLIRALGKNPRSVVDLTAGWCIDAIEIASHGIPVTCFECNPLIYWLMKFALDNSEQLIEDRELELVFANGVDCQQWIGSADVVYLDPMYPETKKTAASPLSITLLRSLLSDFCEGNDATEAQLLQSALQCAKHRVVVKRPHFAPPIEHSRLVGEVKSKQVRFDIYAPD